MLSESNPAGSDHEQIMEMRCWVNRLGTYRSDGYADMHDKQNALRHGKQADREGKRIALQRSM